MAQTSTTTLPSKASPAHNHHHQAIPPPSPPLSRTSLDRSISPRSQPIFSSKYHPEPSPRSMYIADICYPESYLRTPMYELPFPHPKWHVKPGTGEEYEGTCPIVEEYDKEVGSVGEVRESVEGGDGDIYEERLEQQNGGREGDAYLGRKSHVREKRRLDDDEKSGEKGDRKRNRKS